MHEYRIAHKGARTVVSVGLAVSLGLFGAAPAMNALSEGQLTGTQQAWADVNYGTGNVTINNITGQTTTFNGYQLFKANVSDDSTAGSTTGKTETNVAWYNNDVKTAVEQVIKTADSAYTGTTAQDAADYIQQHVTGTDNTTRVSNSDLANKIAAALDDVSTANKTTITAGTEQSLAEGYWLFVTDGTTINANEAGTAPIFAVIGGSDVAVTEKTSIPTVDKTVTNDAGGDGAKAADAQVGQELTYTLTGTVADNVATYSTYAYKFTDTLSAGLDLVTAGDTFQSSDVTVTIDGAPVTSGFTATYENHVLTVDFANLKDAANITSTTQVVVTYKAKINSSAAQGGQGNGNTVKLTYSNNPNTDGTGSTEDKTTNTYTYKLALHKVDRTTEANLAGAKFTIQATGADDAASQNKYVQQDGTLGESPYEFTTDENGEINVSGLDAGTYTVHETAAPNGYTTTADFTFQIKPTYDQATGALTGLANELTATDSVIAGTTDGDTSDNVLKASGSGAADASTGTVTVTVGDVQQMKLPLTGMDGVTFTWIAGGLVLAATIGYGVRSRKRREQE